MGLLVETLTWDTRFFGRRIGRARRGHLDRDVARRLVSEAEADGLECVYLAAAADDLETILVVEANGFHLADVRVVLERDAYAALPKPEDGLRFAIEPPNDGELPHLQQIAVQVSRMSRFAFDPRFSKADTRRLYCEWIASACRDHAGTVLVAREHPGGDALGFLCCKVHGELCDLPLLGVDHRHRLRQVGRALVASGIEWSRARGVTRVRIATQARNVGAQRLLQQLGFLTREVTLYYHLWLTPQERSSNVRRREGGSSSESASGPGTRR